MITEQLIPKIAAHITELHQVVELLPAGDDFTERVNQMIDEENDMLQWLLQHSDRVPSI